jgi:hypothetical protein
LIVLISALIYAFYAKRALDLGRANNETGPASIE